MKILRTGVILNTEHYEACVAFYRELFDLPLLFVKEDEDSHLSCLGLGDGYLMIEKGGTAVPGGKSARQSPHKLRFNVADIVEAQRTLRARGVEAKIETFSWGRSINLHDPDGNRIGIREAAGFEDWRGRR